MCVCVCLSFLKFLSVDQEATAAAAADGFLRRDKRQQTGRRPVFPHYTKLPLRHI